jgi:hypothetical protein
MSRRGHPVFAVLLAGGIGAALIALSRGGSTIVSLSNVTAILAMLVVNVGAFRLARRGWPGKGVKLPGGVLIPALGFAAAAFQLPSLGWEAVLIGTFMMIMGGAMYAARQWKWLAGDLEELKRRIRALETPLLRALRSAEKAVGIGSPGAGKG